jgi:transposase-like protein
VACRKKKKIIIEIMYSEELRCHLGYDKNAQQTGGRTNYRNGTMKKIVRSCNGPIELDVPRDRNGTFEPKIIARYQSDISHIEDRIMAVCEDGISLQDIAATVRKIYGNDVPDELLSRITARICAEVREHQP